jgi:hypothetical protein
MVLRSFMKFKVSQFHNSTMKGEET